METIVQDYSTYPNGAAAEHSHFGSGASAVAGGVLLTTGLNPGEFGGATLDVTVHPGFKRVKARYRLLNVGSGSGDGVSAGGLVLNDVEGSGAAGFSGFRFVCRYYKTAAPDSAACRIRVFGSLTGSTLLAEVAFLVGSFLILGEVLNIEARYTPGVGIANGLLEFRSWREGSTAPAYDSLSVSSGYALMSGPVGVLDLSVDSLGSNTEWLSSEAEGGWPRVVNTTILAGVAVSGQVQGEFRPGSDILIGITLSGSLVGWIGSDSPDEEWAGSENPSTGFEDAG